MNLNSAQPASVATSKALPASLADYVAIARPDNWVKNVFMLPGMLFAYVLYQTPIDMTLLARILVAIRKAPPIQ